ncbi:MAG: DUF58 domain-containing protein [Lentisphaeria bacterium]|nr:DUF58 domain-containing protein [Lentisphaeria bacterium]
MPAFDQLTSRRLSRFRSFELLARSVVEGFVTGLHRSPFKGFAVEFAEHRPYTPGDDVKHLDWKVFGKNEKFFIRQYEEDTSLRAFLMLDTSGSMGYQTGAFSKLDFGRFICGVFAYVLFQQSDSVGAVTFDSNIRQLLSPGGSRRHLKRVLDTFGAAKPGKDTDLGMVMHRLANRLRRRALIVIVSDFFDNSREIIKALTHFSHRHHEIIVFQVLDREEVTFPFSGQTRFEGMEGEPGVLVDPVRVKTEYQRQFTLHQTDIRKACHRLHIDFRQMVTDEPFEKAMGKFFADRMG